MFMNWVQRGGSLGGQNVSNRVIFSQEQGQMALAPQQFDASLYGTPVASGRGTMNQYSHLPAMSHDSENLLAKANDQMQKPAMQPSAFNNSFVGDHCTTASPDQVCSPQGAFVSQQGFQGKNVFGQVITQGSNCGSTLGNLQQGDTLQTNTSPQELSGKQHQAGWPGIFQQKTMQHGPSQGLVPLDPMEEKILFDMDDSTWDSSMGKQSDIGAGGFGNAFESSFPSLQSGSWSALMQSAVAEASSSDTGQQEEWSGLTFQNTELSTGNQPSNIVDNENQGSWADNNLQSVSSLSSKPFPMLNDSSVSSSFPGFPQPDIQFTPEHREGFHQDESHESIQKSPKSSSEWLDRNSQQVQPHMRLDNTWTSQSSKPEGDINEGMYNRNSENHMWNRDGDSRETSHQVQDNNKLDYGKHFISSNKEDNEGIGEKHHKMSNSSHVMQNSYGREGGTYEQQQNCYQRDNSYGRKSEDSSGMRLTAQTRVDQLKENSSIAQFGHPGFNPLSEVTEAKTPGASVSHIYNQSSASQGFALKLASPSQRQSISNTLFSSQGMIHPASNPNQMQMDSNLRGKNQTWSTLSPSQPLPQSHESSPRSRWDDKFGIGGQSSSPTSYKHGNSIAEITSSPTFSRNQLQTQHLFNVPGPSNQTTLPGSSAKHAPSNLALSQDTSQQIFVNSGGQQFPVLEAVPVSQPPFMSGMPARGGVSVKPQSLWTTNQSQQHLSGMETTSLASKELNGLNTQDSGYRSSEFGHSHTSLQGFNSAQEKQEEERMFDASQTGVRNVSDPSDFASGTLLNHSHLQDLGGIHHSDSNGLAPSARNLGFLGHALKHSHGFRHDHSRLHQVQGTKNEEADPSRRDLDVQQVTAMAGQQSIYGHNKDGELNSPSAHKLSPLGNSNATNFLTDAREGLSVKTSSESAFQAQGMVAFGESDSQSPTIGNDVLPNYAETSQPNLSMASNWFKQYGTFRNGQMQPTYDARLARSSAGQTSLVKPSQSLNIHSSVEQIDASDANRVWPSTATNLVTSEPFVAPYVLPSDVIDETMAIVRPKKRKIETSELLPWHKVTEGSKRVQDVSLAEQEWALSCNRLTEKVGHEFEMIEDGRPILRSKRRLIFTTQFLQQLLGPAPASILSADAALYYDSVTYFVAKLSLGDACTLTCSSSTDAPLNDSNTIGEKPKVSENTEMQYLSKAVEDFTNRLKKLENDLLSLIREQKVEKCFLQLTVSSWTKAQLSMVRQGFNFRLKTRMPGVGKIFGHQPVCQVPYPPNSYVWDHFFIRYSSNCTKTIPPTICHWTAAAKTSARGSFLHEAVLAEPRRESWDVEDEKQLICTDCGLVLGDHCVDVTPKRRKFHDQNPGEDRSRVGASLDPLLDNGVLTTCNSKERKQNKKKDNVDGIAPPSNQLNNAVSNPQKSLAKATKYLESMACWLDKHGLPDEVLHDAEVLYKKAVDKKIRSGRKFSRGRKFEVMVAACLFLACQENNNSRTPKEIAKAANGPSRKEINKMVKVLEKELEIRVRV
ncbi:hypothetical protein C1H46_019060 [Malus baccata]|uniref:Cyclin-like domain-containing protein n=1 Tax=Malus baccata TaxID=106549 RepID=A0A540M9A2_MALBA|nr:hypothetical protein C1H46_019060 [Malus baccata]